MNKLQAELMEEQIKVANHRIKDLKCSVFGRFRAEINKGRGYQQPCCGRIAPTLTVMHRSLFVPAL